VTTSGALPPSAVEKSRHRSPRDLLLLVVLAAGGLVADRSDAASWRSPPAPCSVAGRSARCGTLEVPEDRAKPEARSLAIRVVVLPASDAAQRLADPLLVLEGGPGASVLSMAPMHAMAFAALQARRDLVFVEQRGTGESAGLHCGLGANALEPEAAAKCRERLAPNADLRFYGTSHAVADLIDAIHALGYERVNVFAVSYGTRTALELVRRRPERVRSVAMLGTYPPGRNAVLDAPRILDRSLTLLVSACETDERCRGAYAGLGSSITRLSELLDSNDSNDSNGLPASRLQIGSTLRLMLFYPLTTALVPRVVTAAAGGDLAPLRTASGTTASAFGGIADGAFLSILCSEDVARLDPVQVEEAGRGTLLRGTWGAALIDVCRQWTRAEVPADFHAPLGAAVPILSLTGELDPSMPPSWGAELAAALPHARHLTIPQGQHGLIGMSGVGCVLGLISTFVEQGSAQSLDAACLEQVRRPPFAEP
jgi:pimeloyl-ACP methyl ester carboxylesterase